MLKKIVDPSGKRVGVGGGWGGCVEGERRERERESLELELKLLCNYHCIFKWNLVPKVYHLRRIHLFWKKA